MQLSGLGRRTTLTIAGGAMVVAGLILMPVPVLPGFPVVIAGVALIRKARKSQEPESGAVTIADQTQEIDSEAASA